MRTVMILHWAPRVLSIVAILFISVFSLDMLGADRSLKDEITGWLMHMIPSFVLIIVLIIAWKWEKTGGIIFLSLGLAFTPFIFWGNYSGNQSIWISLVIVMTITFPFILSGVLFLLSYHTKQRAREMLKSLERKD